MRQLPNRLVLPATTSRKLRNETAIINKAAERKAEAMRRYSNARQRKWFVPAILALRQMSGIGERCMFCSGNEASDVEHFRPKAIFSELALTWENLFWACAVCNRAKSDNFPTESSQSLVNPAEENVWDYFFIDEFGLLSAIWNSELGVQEPRALSTLKVINLDRETLNLARQQRLVDLTEKVNDTLARFRNGELKKSDLKKRLQKWREQAFQPDVADYFLNGPGKTTEPFKQFFELLN